ncbi:MAG TPA: FG-GAP repeat protein, partial [Pyrinomonadaceae bacterium]|nr:FG-GAP repeat protein [Pyrinomonadaceae bacterium]
VYVRTNSGWQFQQKLTAPDATSQSVFGVSVDVDGDTIVLGAHGDTNAGFASGAAYVFQRSNNQWSLTQKLISSESSTWDSFGLSVGIEGNTIVCGAFGNSPGNTLPVGSAFIFTLVDNHWVETQKLAASDASENNSFGGTVAIDDGTIIVGAIGNSGFAGAVYVFEFDGSSWIEQEKLMSHERTPRVIFGYRLGIDGDTIVVASEGRADPPIEFSAAYIFRRTPSGWHQQKKITTDDVFVNGRLENMGRFGLTVAVSGDTVVVGSPNDPTINYWSGSAYIYRRTSESNWSLDQQIFPSDAARDDSFASAVAISGNTALMGAWVKFSPEPFAGAAYLYDF